MSNLILSAQMIFPLFVMITLGYLLRKIDIFDERVCTKLNKFVFSFLMPAVLFNSICLSEFDFGSSIKILAFALISLIALFIVLMLVAPRFIKDKKDSGVLIQGVFRSNFILLGLPICIAVYGEDNIQTTVLLIAFIVPLFNVLSVITFQSLTDKKPDFKSLTIGIFTNPIMIAAVAGFGLVILGIELPTVILDTVSDISSMTTPLALIVLGAGFTLSGVKKYWKVLSWTVLLRLLVVPAVILAIASYLGFEGEELVSTLILFASPTAVSSFTMAKNYNANEELAGQVVVVTTLFSMFTLSLFLSIFTF